MSSEYWNKWWGLRSSRRRFLQAGAATGVGAAGIALVGCGDDDDDDSTAATNTPGGLQATNTPVPEATATPTPSITPGGDIVTYADGDPPSINPYGTPSYRAKVVSAFVYSRLFKLGTASGLNPALAVPEPDAAASYEAIDNTTYTVKLQPNIMFHDVAPVNGRQLTTDDVKFSYGLATAPDNGNAGRLTSVIDSIDYTDDLTMTFNLKQPNAEFIDLLADTNLLYIMPTESDGGFDPATNMIGSGPWIFDHYQTSVDLSYNRNPNWFAGENGTYPYADTFTYKIIVESATQLAQFLSGQLDFIGPNNNDLPDIVDQVSGVQLSGLQSQLISFFYWSDINDTTKAWSNPLVRQAISMCIDRDADFDLHYNAKVLADAGIEMARDYNNIIPAGMKRWWLDPQSSDFGDNQKFYQYSAENAKAALAAAGFDNPNDLKFKFQYSANAYGSAFNSVVEANILFMNDIGLNPEVETQDYVSTYFPNTFSKGDFTGLAYGYETPFPVGGGYPQRFFTDNPLNQSKVKDADLLDLTNKQQQELDEETRKGLFWDIQNLNAERSYYFANQSGAGTGFIAYQPRINNNDRRTLFYGAGVEEYPYYFFNNA